MTEAELRELVRQSIARHMNEKAESLPAGSRVHFHPSHGVFPLASGEADGACLIEPTVRCNHCHYCQSYGH